MSSYDTKSIVFVSSIYYQIQNFQNARIGHILHFKGSSNSECLSDWPSDIVLVGENSTEAVCHLSLDIVHKWSSKSIFIDHIKRIFARNKTSKIMKYRVSEAFRHQEYCCCEGYKILGPIWPISHYSHQFSSILITPPMHSSYHTCPVSWTLSTNYYWSDTLEVTEKKLWNQTLEIFWENANFIFSMQKFGLFWQVLTLLFALAPYFWLFGSN